ncbi:MAG: YceD family protein [Legionellaceae bacterium]|nr:YceD family protein [Legionellaceae bacterium]
MKICLKKYVKQQKTDYLSIKLEERLPGFVQSPCELTYQFQVEQYPNYYLIKLDVKGVLSLVCQRCLGDYQYAYHNQTLLAVCRSETVAEQLMSSYDCIVSETGEIDLSEIITDELHLFCPEKHEDLTQCQVPNY